ncbi:MAG: glycosyltransferase family 4 protein [Gemmatimonadota bacterium]
MNLRPRESTARRVLYVEANEDGTVGGSHKILYDLVTRLSPKVSPTVLFYQANVWADRLRDQGVDVVTWDDIRRQERKGLKEGGKVSTAVALAGAIRHRRHFLRDGRFDLVHLNNSPFIGYDDWLPACRLAGIPCTTYVMGGLMPPKDSLQAFGIRRFDAYFPLSVLMEEFLEAQGIDRQKIVLTYPGIDLSEVDAREFRPADQVREEFGLTPGQLLVVMVGNIRHWKGQHVVVEALAGLGPEEREGIRLLFVGDTNEETAAYKAGLVEAVEGHGLADTVTFTGRRDDVPDLLEAADIAVHASVEPEPFGLVVQEAMIHGCATVAADEGGPVEMITEGSGLTFNAAEPDELTKALRMLIGDAELRHRLAREARLRARFFDQVRHVETVEARYAQLLGTVPAREHAS